MQPTEIKKTKELQFYRLFYERFHLSDITSVELSSTSVKKTPFGFPQTHWKKVFFLSESFLNVIKCFFGFFYLNKTLVNVLKIQGDYCGLLDKLAYFLSCQFSLINVFSHLGLLFDRVSFIKFYFSLN